MARSAKPSKVDECVRYSISRKTRQSECSLHPASGPSMKSMHRAIGFLVIVPARAAGKQATSPLPLPEPRCWASAERTDCMRSRVRGCNERATADSMIRI